jgi:iron complex outermembrane receptor protein
MKKSNRLRARAFVPALSVLSMAVLSSLQAQTIDAGLVTVTATRVEFKEKDAPYAVEVHSRSDISESGAVSLFDYLSKYTSLQVASAYGDSNSPFLSMRGYGLENGHQNMVISVNGQRLNSMDMTTPVLGSISLQDIERIEITKGTGSTLYGDGAMAGTVQIITKPLDGARAQAYAGNKGANGWGTQVGMHKDGVQLSASADGRDFAGNVDKNSKGFRDTNKASNWQVDGGWSNASNLQLKAFVNHAEIDSRYNNSMSEVQWKSNPYINKGVSHQQYLIDTWGTSAQIALSGDLSLGLTHQDQTKRSDYLSATDYPLIYDYRSQNSEATVSGKYAGLKWVTGVQTSEGIRTNTDGQMQKNNHAVFAQFHKSWEQLTWMLGGRDERVRYKSMMAANGNLEKDHHLPQWETGLNFSQSESVSWFGTFAKTYQAPDVDRFFSPIYDADWNVVGQSFNSFIVPAQAQTLTLGFNHLTSVNKFKLALFRSNLHNEIYYDSVNSNNTNLDKSHKEGIELQDVWTLNSKVTLRANYAYTVAKIDDANSTNPSYNGKELPGVSKNMLLWGVRWQPAGKHALNLSQTWRSETYALNDFTNSAVQRQPSYRSTDVSYQYAVSKDTQIFAAVSNLLSDNNALVTKPNAFYAVDFSRTWRVGLKTAF